MKLYDCNSAPSPRRVRIFIAEKKLDIDVIQVDLMAGEHRKSSFAKINPWLTVPVLELDDGTFISEINACCRYIEEINPKPSLMGDDAREKAVVEMWNQRVESDGYNAVSEAFRNSSKGFKNRALTGPREYEQISLLADRGKQRIRYFFEMLDARLKNNQFICGDKYSVADITAFVTIDFARWLKISPAEEQTNLKRWYEEVNSRPSASA